MEKDITWVALDTAKKQHVGAVLRPGSREPEDVVVPNERRAVQRLVRRLVREAPGPVRVCYEAGPCGFVLKRWLEAAVPRLCCEVIAPALVPVRPGARIKTDRRDARKLVRLYRAGELTVVHPPSEAEEAVRDLVRCREDAKQDLLRARHRLAKFLLRRGVLWGEGRPWTGKHRRWLAGLCWAEPADRFVFDDYRLAIEVLGQRVTALDAHLDTVAQTDPYADAVGWLRCFRGIDTVTAMTVLAELHDISRFERARDLMSFLGLVPSEHSSGDRSRRGALTKAGNAHVRRVLVETAWSCRHRPVVGYALRRRRKGQPEWAIAHADRAMHRLSRRYQRLLLRGKPHNKVIAAVAKVTGDATCRKLTRDARRRRDPRDGHKGECADGRPGRSGRILDEAMRAGA